jgi:putative peptidoglycan lipid II flippase
MLLAARRAGFRWRWQWEVKDVAVQKVAAQYLPVAASAVLMTGAGVIDQAMAAMLAPGSVAALGYGNKVVAFIIGLGSTSLGTAVFPHFARMAANADWQGVRHTFRTYARLILLITIPLTLLLFFLSEALVRLIYERGAFSIADTKLVGRVQAFYFLQMPFHVLGILGVRLLSALARNQALIRITGINLLVNIAANYLFMRYMGVAGISLSTSLVYLVSMSLILWTLRRELGKLEAARTQL